MAKLKKIIAIGKDNEDKMVSAKYFVALENNSEITQIRGELTALVHRKTTTK